MVTRTVVQCPISAATADTTKVIDVGSYEAVTIYVAYTQTGSSTGTLTIKGSTTLVGAAADLYLLDIATEAGTRDADGAIAHTTTGTTTLLVAGANKFLSLDWNEGTDGATISVYVIGRYNS